MRNVLVYVLFIIALIYCYRILIRDQINSAQCKTQNLEMELAQKKKEINILTAKYINLKDEFTGLGMLADNMQQDNRELQAVIDTLEAQLFWQV